jgi:hypothetical protein
VQRSFSSPLNPKTFSENPDASPDVHGNALGGSYRTTRDAQCWLRDESSLGAAATASATLQTDGEGVQRSVSSPLNPKTFSENPDASRDVHGPCSSKPSPIPTLVHPSGCAHRFAAHSGILFFGPSRIAPDSPSAQQTSLKRYSEHSLIIIAREARQIITNRIGQLCNM